MATVKTGPAWLVILLLSCAVWVSGARAEQQVELYTAEALVTSQSSAERRRAAREGLADLMVRVTGDPEAPEHSMVQDALSRAENFIYEFNYVSTDETLEVEGEPVPASRLVMKFSPVELERLLRSAGLSLWPASRPGVLVWMVERGSDGPERTSDAEKLKPLRDQARNRGLPLVLPLDDLEDQLAISARELWALDEEAIQEASQRYDAEAILVGRYSETSGGQWRSDWQLYHDLGNPTFYVRADSVDALLTQAVNETANHFADLYAIVPREEGPGSVVLEVGGIDGFGEFKSAERYLEALPMVRRADLVAVRPGVSTLRLMSEGDPSRLLDALERDQQLTPASRTDRFEPGTQQFAPQGTLANPLVYIWQ